MIGNRKYRSPQSFRVTEPTDKRLSGKSQRRVEKRKAREEKESRSFVPSGVLKPIGAKDLDNLTLPKSRRHWHPQVRPGRLGMIFAPRATGKSTFELSLGMAMVHKAEFLGYRSGGPRRVVILDGEMDLETLQARARQAAAALNVKPDNKLRFVSPELFKGLMPSLSTPEGQKIIDKAIGTEWDVLFVDNYSAFSATGREDAESWAPWIRWMLKHKRRGRTVIVLHHSGKNGQQRGSSKHEDALDFVIGLRPLPNAVKDGALRFTFQWTKARHTSSDKTVPFVATFAPNADGRYEWSRSSVEDADERRKKAKELVAADVPRAEIVEQLGIDKSTLSRWLKPTSD